MNVADSEKLLADLNPQQRQAVTCPGGPLLVLAGAGSGKTRVLTHRVAWLVATGAARPHELLAITFTNKAANEMKERIETLLGPVARTMWISTFHAACARILRREAPLLGYESNFTIYDAADQVRLVRRCLKQLDYDVNRFPPKGVHAVISAAKNRLVGPEDFAEAVDGFFEETVARTYERYQKQLYANNAMDFDDLVMLTVQLFERFPERLEHYRQSFRHVLVDEYQDTNHAQYRLVNQLAGGHRNVCVVGDDDQSIYSWRGADIRNILDFEQDYPEATVIKLEQNYRSTQTILDAANSVVDNNRGRKQKRLWTDAHAGDPVQVVELEDEHAEARFLAGEIVRLQEQHGYTPSQIAVFYRVNAQSRVIEDMLVRYGIQYRVVGGTRFYERAEIKDALAYLLLVDNPADDVSFRRVVNAPKRGIGAATVATLEEAAATEGQHLLEAAAHAGDIPGLRPQAVKALKSFAALIEGLREKSESLPVAELLEEMLEASGYLAALAAERTIEAEGRMENLEELVGVATEFEQRVPGGSLGGFLQEISLYTDVDKLEAAEESVTLMTIHNAKGLEFPVVFIAGAEEGVFPHSRALDEQNLEEERRLCYVGMTRAMKRLYFTYAETRNLYGSRHYNMASRFIDELPPELVEKHAAASVRSPAPLPGAFSRGEAGAGFETGDRVLHAHFGEGTVTAVASGGMVTVRFDEGGDERTLLLEYAPLKRLRRG